MLRTPVAAAASLLALGGVLATAPLAAQNEEWSTELSLQATAANFEGKHVVDTLNAKTGIGGSELFKNLQLGGSASLFGKGERWAWSAEGWAVDMKNNDIQATTIAVDQTEAEVDGMLQVYPGVHAFLGARYLSVRDRISATREAGFFSAEHKEDWVEPTVGVRMYSRIGHDWSFTGRAGIGGFGAGSSFSWDVAAYFAYDLSKTTAVGLGYRLLSEDVDKGHDPTRFRYDTVVSAFTGGLTFRF